MPDLRSALLAAGFTSQPRPIYLDDEITTANLPRWSGFAAARFDPSPPLPPPPSRLSARCFSL
jgi:hypothetical protein